MVALLRYILAVVVFSVLDLIWITSNYQRYNDMVNHVSGKPISLNYFAVLVTYVLLIFGLFVFVLPNINKTSTKSIALSSLHYGGLFGFTIYGVYNFTNLSVFKNYDAMTAILDTCWGCVLFTVAAFIISVFT